MGLLFFASDARADITTRLVDLLNRPQAAHHALADDDGRIPLAIELPDGVDARAMGLLPIAPGFATIRLAPGEVAPFTASHPDLVFSVAPPRHLLLDRSMQWTRVAEYRGGQRGPNHGDGRGVVVGILDTGIDLSHADFRNEDGTTRVAWLLKAGAPAGKHPELEAAFGCSAEGQAPCAVYDAQDIDRMLVFSPDELPRDVVGHGTHVSSIAAGNGGPMRFVTPTGTAGGPCDADGACKAGQGTCTEVGGKPICAVGCKATPDCGSGALFCGKVDEVSTKICLRGGPTYVGVAPKATLVVAAPAAGFGFRDPDIVNAASFIFDRAAAMGMPAVVNLSIGGDFGPHDGTSPLEKGLAALVGDDKPGRALVVAAGNSGALYTVGQDGPLGVHTEVHVSPDATTRVPILTPKSTDGQGFAWITFRPGDDVSVALEAPGGDTWIGFVDPHDDGGYEGDDGTTAAVINALANGKSAITPDTNSAVVAFDGAWKEGHFTILLRGHGDAQLWVVGQGDVAQTVSVGLSFDRAIKQGTVNVPASHPKLLAVGCTVNRVGWTPLAGPPVLLAALGPEAHPTPDGMCYFSSAGPTPEGVPKPEISAPGGFIAAAMSADADPRKTAGGLFDGAGCPSTDPCFVVDDYHAVTAGSSMSAPHVAGAIALLMERDPTLTQARATAVLQAGARYPQHEVPFDYQMGVGSLDVMGAIAALPDEQAASAVPVDVGKSWLVLSSSYARPDPTWPVWGTLELRRQDGSIAAGLDGAALSLSVQGGVVMEPLRQIRKGLWRFAVAGEHGSGGGQMTLTLAYAGQPIGAPRVLPIGADIWAAREGFDATGGGCSCRAGESSLPRGHAVAAAVAAVVLLVARGRRRRQETRC